MPAVDDSPAEALAGGLWLGVVIPKRHARRAVTRNLIRRAIRHAACAHADALRAGLCVVRLRAPVRAAEFPSAASEPLSRLVHAELADLFGRAGAR